MKNYFTYLMLFMTPFVCLSQSHTEALTGLTLSLKEQQSIPALTQKVHIGEKPSENCTCNFIVEPRNSNKDISLDEIFNISSVKKIPLFDGSQRTIFYMFIERSSNYFKFECFSPVLRQEDLLAFFEIKR